MTLLEVESESKIDSWIPDVFRKSGYQGYKIFIDRYTEKKRKGDMELGDLAIVVTEKHPKFPKKELGVIAEIDSRGAVVELLEGGRFYQEFGLIDVTNERHPDQVRKRVAKALASVENEDIREQIESDFEEILINYFIPGGRVLAGAGLEGLTLANCFVIASPHDSRKGFFESLTEMAEAHARGGGVGVNDASLRPRYSHVEGVNGTSSGSVSWGEMRSVETGLIEQGGSRRGATMLMTHDWHPDVFEFVDVKSEPGRFENVNMSVCISDRFMETLLVDGDWNLMFPKTSHPAYDTEWDGDIWEWVDKGYEVDIYETIKASKLWDKIVNAAWASAEPGLHFLERSNKLSNTYYFAKLVATNPCGEQPLPAYGVCCLGAVDLSRVLQNDPIIGYYIDYDKLRKTVHKSVRFLDNVIDLNEYHDEKIDKAHHLDRRIGLGTMGLGELLVKLRLRYGSDESVAFIDNLYQFIATEAYLASADLAAEKGSFPGFDAELFLQSGYMQNMPENVREAIRTKGLRNACLLTQAPNGTTGTMMGTTTGLEPYFAWVLSRNSRLGTHEEVAYVLQELGLDVNNLPNFCVTAMELTPYEHLAVQAAIQRWIDSAISKTTNVPADYTVEEVDELYREAWLRGCKGVTIYRDGSRSEQVLTVVKNAQTQDNNCEVCGEILIKTDGCVSCLNGCYSLCSL